MITDCKAALESEKKGLKKQLEILSGDAAAKWRADIQNIEKEMKVVNFTDEEIVREMINEGEAVTMFKNLTKEGEPAQFCLDLQVPAFRKRTPQDVYVPRYWYLTKQTIRFCKFFYAGLHLRPIGPRFASGKPRTTSAG